MRADDVAGVVLGHVLADRLPLLPGGGDGIAELLHERRR